FLSAVARPILLACGVACGVKRDTTDTGPNEEWAVRGRAAVDLPGLNRGSACLVYGARKYPDALVSDDPLDFCARVVFDGVCGVALHRTLLRGLRRVSACGRRATHASGLETGVSRLWAGVVPRVVRRGF